MIRKSTILLSLLLGCLVCSQAQQWSGVLSTSRATDWSSAGATIIDRTSACATFSPGATAAQINAQLQNSACANKVVQLNAGTYNLSAGLDFGGRSDVTLRGAGANKTFLIFSGNAGCTGLTAALCIAGDSSLVGGSSGLNPDNTATWTATSYATGQNQITLSSVANLKVGNPLILDQCNSGLSGASCTGTETDTGNVYVCDKGSPNCAALDGPSGGQRSGRAQLQIVTVTNISGSVVTFTPALRMPNWSSARTPGAFWSSAPNKGVGVEDLSVDFTNASVQSGIVIWNCSNCWVKGIRSVYSTHNGTAERNHIWLVLSPHATIRDSYFYGSASLHSEGYGVEAYPSSDSLIENNIFQNMPSPQMINAACSGCVVGYNFSINDANDSSYLFNSLTLHAGGIDNTLVEGNIGNSYREDYFHGSHNFNTAFRNYYNGWESGITGGLVASITNAQGRYTNQIGNVFGRAGTTTNYQITPSGGSEPAVYEFGLGNGTLANDNLVLSTAMRWGNYDVVNGAVRWQSSEVPSAISQYSNPVPSSQSLPASFYLNSKPAWWGNVSWPAIGPDVTNGNISGVGGHANKIPAQVCYESMNGPVDGTGAVLPFNADACYGQSGVQPAAPSGLTSVVH